MLFKMPREQLDVEALVKMSWIINSASEQYCFPRIRELDTAKGIDKIKHFSFFPRYILDKSQVRYHFFLNTSIITKKDCESKGAQPQSIMVPSVHLSRIGNWHMYHFEKLWFMSLVHCFPSSTITQDYLLFEGKPSTKHLRGSYGLCFSFTWC